MKDQPQDSTESDEPEATTSPAIPVNAQSVIDIGRAVWETSPNHFDVVFKAAVQATFFGTKFAW